MAGGKMHADEVDTDAGLVRRLLAGQFPHWANLSIEPVESAGTDHAIYRLGDTMSVRLPRIEWATGQAERESYWLPRLAPHLPVEIPAVLAKGEPAEGYPWHWSVYRWIEGETATPEGIADLRQVAVDLADFVAALHSIDPSLGQAGPHRVPTGTPLEVRDSDVRACIASLHGIIDAAAVTRAWEASLQAPEWDGVGVWVHADLLPTNLLIKEGMLSAVIDFGGLKLGDPACDMLAGWSLFDKPGREMLRTALRADDATWARGRGWALSKALIALPYYLHTNPVFVEISLRIIGEVLANES